MFTMIAVSLGGYNQYTDTQYITRDEPAPYGDVYVELAAQNLKLLYDAQDELARLNLRSVCDVDCIARKATLKERIRNLQQ